MKNAYGFGNVVWRETPGDHEFQAIFLQAICDRARFPPIESCSRSARLIARA
jgi:hypothetical protein